MNIVITGSLGHISKPLTENLIKEGHKVTVVSSDIEKSEAIESMGAIPAIGSLENVTFLTNTFQNVDAVYCIIPPNFKEINQVEYYRRIATNYATAIQQSGVKHVVHLSSWGAHLDRGTGIILGSHNSEKIFSQIPSISLVFIRPGSFYYNTFGFINMIKHLGYIGANYGEHDNIVWVHPIDIAAAVSEELLNTSSEKLRIRYVASDEKSAAESAQILGAAIGIPDLQWKLLSVEIVKNILVKNGLPESIASDIVDLNNSIHTGALAEDYNRHKPILGKVKVKDFAEEFAMVYNKK
ncbi:SDR family oxidoreductase [Rhizosphaericola mali]|uniref:NAD(P)H-binding protein n=1 Tax=Rhizosphaericola mali TaxID=2545455 RepID=A0A5P2G343_9BACT|nr:NAD(P)H-binding protein [Rhizosphaericola mali]QES88242.1 NAD(P)H-binding protein [Rhizosphaericola mali]